MVFPNQDESYSKAVRVLSRGLTLIRAFCPRNRPLNNGELSVATGLTRPTVSRITATLTRMGYLDYLPNQARYRLGEAALALGFGAIGSGHQASGSGAFATLCRSRRPVGRTRNTR